MSFGQALGVLDVRGMAALMGATDTMLKTALVRVCGIHRVGSGWVTVVINGTVDAVEAAISVGQMEVAKRGALISADVIARADGDAMAAMPHGQSVRDIALGSSALGLLETRGIVPIIAGADAMVKAASVSLGGWATVGSALLHVVVRGDVASVQAALDAGKMAAEKVGQVVATLNLPNPDAGLASLLPPPVKETALSAGGLGVLETTGYVGAVGGFDQMIKASHVSVCRILSGSGGRLGTLFTGDLDAVEAAAGAAADGAKTAGVFETCHIISRPAVETLSCFVGEAVNRSVSNNRLAMGLIETRSTVALVMAMDQMLKTANVKFEGSYKSGSFLTSSVIRGDVDAVRTALNVGAVEAAKHGELVSTHIIPNPLPEMNSQLAHHS